MISHKKKTLLISALSGVLALTAAGAMMTGGHAFDLVPTGATGTTYTLNVAANADLAAVQTDLGNTIAFTSRGYTSGTFTSGGIVGNTTAISGLQSLAITITSGSFDVYKSWDGTNYYDLALTLNSSSNTYSFTDAPSYLKIVASEASVISGFSVVYSCAKSDIPTTFLGFPVGYGSKVYDATAAALPYVPSGVTASWEDSSKAALGTAPSAVGTYYVKLTNGTDTQEKQYSITPYTTDIIAGESGIEVDLDINGDSFLRKGSSGELIVKGWWVNLLFTGATVPTNATGMKIHMKSDTALSNVEYNYSYPGVSLGSGHIASIGTDYSDITLSLAKNGCQLQKLAMLVTGATLTISSISFTIPVSNIPDGQTGIFTHLGTNYPAVTTEAFRGSSACTFYNSASDDSLAFGGQWWDEVIFNGTTGVAIPSGKTTMTLSMKGSAAFSCVYVFSGTPANFAYDESTGFAITTDYKDFTISLNSSVTMVNSFGFCTSNNYVFIKSVTFA